MSDWRIRTHRIGVTNWRIRTHRRMGVTDWRIRAHRRDDWKMDVKEAKVPQGLQSHGVVVVVVVVVLNAIQGWPHFGASKLDTNNYVYILPGNPIEMEEQRDLHQGCAVGVGAVFRPLVRIKRNRRARAATCMRRLQVGSIALEMQGKI